MNRAYFMHARARYFAQQGRSAGALAPPITTGFGGVDGTVNAAIWLPDGGWIVGGTFANAQPYLSAGVLGASVARANLARFNSDGSLHAWNPGANNTVRALAIAGTDVIAGGLFATLGGASRSRIGAVPLDSNTATSWNPDANNTVYSLAVNGTDTIVAGAFTAMTTPPVLQTVLNRFAVFRNNL